MPEERKTHKRRGGSMKSRNLPRQFPINLQTLLALILGETWKNVSKQCIFSPTCKCKVQLNPTNPDAGYPDRLSGKYFLTVIVLHFNELFSITNLMHNSFIL
jgi:hypothetical protein